jgi:CHAD domain-containing protein
MAKARAIRGLERETPFREAAARVIEVRASEVFKHRAGVLDTSDIERVHDMRVATRRLRAAMEIFAPCFPRKEYAAVLREVKQLADTLGERRDPDVRIAALQRIEASLTRDEAPGVESLVAELRSGQAAANLALAEALEAIDDGGLQGRLAALAAAARLEAALA